jgi:mannose-6-phosphate isomerase-like protein (cupin superfamily)
MKFSLKNARKLEWKDKKTTFWIYNSKDDFKNASCAYIEMDKGGRHGKVKTKLSDRIYYVLDGEGEFVVGGSSFEVKSEEVVIIPKNTPYDYKAINKMKLFLVHTPAYDGDFEVRYEERGKK